MKRDNNKDIKDAISETLVDSFLNVGSESAGELVKEAIKSSIGEILVDFGASLISGVAGAFSELL